MATGLRRNRLQMRATTSADSDEVATSLLCLIMVWTESSRRTSYRSMSGGHERNVRDIAHEMLVELLHRSRQ